VLVFVALATAAAGCGSDESGEGADASATTTWADGLCGALRTWKGSLTQVGETLRDFENLSKSKLERAADDVANANAKLSDDVEELGEPPKVGQDDADAAVEDLSSKLRTSADEVRSATEDVSTPAEALQAVNVASGALLTMSSDISATVAELESIDAADAWRQAFADSDACQSLSNS